MDIDTCIAKYLELSAAAFQPKRHKANLVGKAKDVWKTDGAYRAESLAAEFKRVTAEVEGDENAPLFDPESGCKV